MYLSCLSLVMENLEGGEVKWRSKGFDEPVLELCQVQRIMRDVTLGLEYREGCPFPLITTPFLTLPCQCTTRESFTVISNLPISSGLRTVNPSKFVTLAYLTLPPLPHSMTLGCTTRLVSQRQLAVPPSSPLRFAVSPIFPLTTPLPHLYSTAAPNRRIPQFPSLPLQFHPSPSRLISGRWALPCIASYSVDHHGKASPSSPCSVPYAPRTFTYPTPCVANMFLLAVGTASQKERQLAGVLSACSKAFLKRIKRSALLLPI